MQSSVYLDGFLISLIISPTYTLESLFAGKTIPETPCLTVVPSPPTLLVIVGIPQAAASLGVMPAASNLAGWMSK